MWRGKSLSDAEWEADNGLSPHTQTPQPLIKTCLNANFVHKCRSLQRDADLSESMLEHMKHLWYEMWLRHRGFYVLIPTRTYTHTHTHSHFYTHTRWHWNKGCLMHTHNKYISSKQSVFPHQGWIFILLAISQGHTRSASSYAWLQSKTQGGPCARYKVRVHVQNCKSGSCGVKFSLSFLFFGH